MTPISPMDTESSKTEYDRSQRAASVLSGMSAEDMEAAETLNSLFTSRFERPHWHLFANERDVEAQSEQNSTPQPVPTHIQTSTSYNGTEPEPLLTLLTSTHPLAAPLIHGSLSVYKTAQSYIPGAEWTERNVGLPLAGTIGRVTGVEGGIRWALQRRDGPQSGQGHSSQPGLSDVEKGLSERSPSGHRRSSDVSFETLPAYNPGDRSPPYSEQQVVLQTQQRQPPPGWRQQLVISTSGLGVAMSEESLRSLRYCLSWLQWANNRLGGAIASIRELLQRWDEESSSREYSQPMSVASMTQPTEASRQAALASRIAALKADVLHTLKQVVGVVSSYAGGALPENARNLVHRHLTSLPQRFSIASARPSNNSANGNEAAGSAQRVLVLAQEGLDMMTQVSGVVNDTLVAADSWCERLGRKRAEQTQEEHHQHVLNGVKEEDNRGHRDSSSVTLGRDSDANVDIKMEGY